MVALTITKPDIAGGPVMAWHGSGLTIDLTEVTFIHPYGIACLASQMHAAVERGKSVAIAPGSGDVANYCQRMNLFASARDLKISVDDPTPGQGRRDLSDSLFECTQVHDSASIERLVNLVTHRLDDAGVQPETTDAINFIIYEMADNVLSHAQISHGYAVAQTFPQRNRFQFAIADGGVGIPALHPAETDGESVARAMEYGVSSAAQQRGRGFSHLTRTVAELDGRTLVRSGQGGVSRYRDANSRILNGMSQHYGTVVAAEMPI